MLSTYFFTQVINGYLPEPHASLLNGILLGIPVRGQTLLYNQLKTVGLVHIVVLSGMNITLLSAIITNITSHLGKKISLLTTIATIIIFISFVGAQPPVIRAGFMGVLTLIGILLGRKTLVLYSLLLSAIFIAIFWPSWPTTISFQLSYAATLGLILFSKKGAPTKNEETNNTLKGKLTEYVYDEWRTSMSAQIFTVPLICVYFRQISLISPIANILVSWTIAPLMIFGFMAAILGKIHFALGIVPAYISYGILTYIIFVVEMLSKVPFASISF